MAYLDFAEVGQLAPVIARHDPIPVTATLTALERSVVALAKRDALSSLREPGRLATAIAAVFGGSRDNRLADPRLEALRRVSVYAWRHGFAVPASEVDAFLEAGFDAEQLELLVTSINHDRNARRHRRA